MSFIDRPARHCMRKCHIAIVGLAALVSVLALGELLFHVGQHFAQPFSVLAARLVGYSRLTPVEAGEVRQSFGVPADMPMKDVGEVQFRAGVPKRLRLGSGNYCTMTAAVLTNGSVQLNLLYEFSGEVVDGVKTQSHSERAVSVFRPDRVRGDWRLCLFPKGQHLVVAIRPVVVP